MRPRTSVTRSGGAPKSSATPAESRSFSWTGCQTETSPSRTSWKRSLSAETTSTASPARAPFSASVPMRSSASKPGSSTTASPIARQSAFTSATCGTRSSGIAARVALYWGSISCRNVFSGRSKQTATASGFLCERSFRSIVANPNVAFVGRPSGAESGRIAWKAR